MSWNQKQISYGVIKVDGRKVKVYETSTSHSTITATDEVLSAHWAGGDVVVNLKNGKTHKYATSTSYTTI